MNKEEVLSIDKSISKSLYFFIKRIFDIICALIGMVFLIPVTFIVKICYILTGDFTSIFYAHDRIGKDGKIFKLYKFRSMVPNADKILEEMLKDPEIEKEYKKNMKLDKDPRITKVGRIIRKTSIDEMPQFINVLIGNMSMIGNRPYLPREKKDMGKYYASIVSAKPGITGYWQTTGRNDIDFKSRLKLEQYYSEHMSLSFDIKIFFKTFKVVLLCFGAK